MANTFANLGLVLFVVVVMADIFGLCLDLFYLVNDRRTITGFITHHPAWSVPVIGGQFLGVFGLCCHFLMRVDNG